MEEEEDGINVSPLIDVVFILLIFFIVSATFVTLPGVDVSRPRVENAAALQKNSVLFALSADTSTICTKIFEMASSCSR